ncbi:MAG: GNAT family N-acetyltransferase [Oscillospiraceae bacterium]|nr:GNAT family N-acetyltransferase [Oscillospiraceae bacterium]
MKIGETFYTDSRSEWRAWLSEHFETSKEIWFVFPDRSSEEAGLPYNDAVEEALCFGWIDGQAAKLDDDHTARRFSPRRKGSGFSQPNIERLKWLDGQGLIHEKVRPSVEDVIAKPFEWPPDIMEALRQDDETWNNFNAFSEGYRRIRIAYIDAARARPGEFEKRLGTFLARTKAGKRISGYGGVEKYYGETSPRRTYFMKTARIGFSLWESTDIHLAEKLWGDPKVTRYICASGVFSEDDIMNRLEDEIKRYRDHRVQYWPIFELATGNLIGCCGLRPHGKDEYELGFHLCPEYWGMEYAKEAASAVIGYAFGELRAERITAGHNPENTRSRRVIEKLGFRYTGDEFYKPTGLYHPSYVLYPKTQDPERS